MLYSSHKGVTSGDEDSNPYWISFADIMAGLLVLFILAAIALLVDVMEQEKEVDDRAKEIEKQQIELESSKQLVVSLQQKVIEQRIRFEENIRAADNAKRDILYEIRDELRSRGINVLVSDNETVLRIPDDVLSFDQSKWNITPQYKKSAAQIGEVLYRVITKKIDGESRERFLDTIFIEGHTDSSPFTGFLTYEEGNWPLSSFRAITIWEFWNQELSKVDLLENLKNHTGTPLFSVSGYAGTRPIESDQSTPENQRKNRRIDIRFTVVNPVIDSLVRDVKK